jgi:hypothetical protein
MQLRTAATLAMAALVAMARSVAREATAGGLLLSL